MATFTITGDDTLTLFDRVFADIADGDTSTITFPNDLVTMKTGKNGNALYSRNAQGNNADVVLRLVKGSSDDEFLQSQLDAQERDFPSFALANGSFVKRLGNGLGDVKLEKYQMQGGVIRRIPDSKENVEGDTEQAVTSYQLMFTRAGRSIG
jgi:hypothetical protein